MVDTDQAKADEAKKTLDGTDAQGIIDTAKAAKGKVAVDQIDVQQKQQALDNATTNKQKSENDLNSDKIAVDTVKKDVDNKQAEADKTQATFAQAKAKRDQAHDKVAEITDKLNSINTIVLPDGYGSVKSAKELD
ncbi:hypothetical protein [Ligilactobacillus apodemi]|uniref:Uncharacterized protein n=1 Tax=Ligilactobacillus apodemi DSM 16634 = JCM 16172 TaxID=1423724 RepID=A0A0R1TZB6_9LACO|nr:hypothetical protein [Ligilactobacillus apodemi]KRL83938.1 hypothetical protein FC32_GL001208 [Ligilactobacillus apodemi DSM 16634 = JCM 16172]